MFLFYNLCYHGVVQEISRFIYVYVCMYLIPSPKTQCYFPNNLTEVIDFAWKLFIFLSEHTYQFITKNLYNKHI